MPKATARPSYLAYAETKGFHRLPTAAIIESTMRRLVTEGADANAKAVADALIADGYEVDRTFVAKAIYAHRLTAAVATTAIRELQQERALSLGEVLDLRVVFDGTYATKGLTAFMVEKIKERIERGDWPWPEDPRDAIRMIEALGALDRSATEASKAAVETALLTPAALATTAKDVTPGERRGRFAALMDD